MRHYDLNYRRVERTLDEIKDDNERLNTYIDHWAMYEPETFEDYFNFWVYALFSVHTRWQTTVKGFLAVKDIARYGSVAELTRAQRKAKSGMYELRVPGLLRLREQFWAKPEKWCVKPYNMVEARDEMVVQLTGLANAKTSFAYELCFPFECDVVCLDTHMLNLYGHPSTTPNDTYYARMENHWVYNCKARGLPSAIARHMYFDNVQRDRENKRKKKPITPYQDNCWSMCLLERK